VQAGALQPAPLPALPLRTGQLQAAPLPAVSAPEQSREGWLLADLRSLACRRADGGIDLVDLPGGRAVQADGRFGEELRAAFEGGREGPLLRALPDGHPVRRLLAELDGRPARPLTAAEALRLGGFGILFIELTARCNLSCLHCYASAGPERGAELPREQVEQLLEEAAALGFELVQLTGGEPLLHPSVADLCRRARALGLCCEIFSNGQLLEGVLFDELVAAGASFAFSLYAGSPEVHDRITGVAGSHARTVAAIRRVVEHGLSPRVAVIAMPENAGQLAAALALAHELGASARAGGSAAVGRGQRFASAELDATLADEAPGWDAPRGKLCVAADGSVLPCIFNRRQVLGRLGERSLAQIVAAPGPLPAAPAGDPLTRAAELPCLDCQLTALALQRV
jgi:MoaA/NifB/PqqE/SkfB family radical SAM enzyme